MGSTVSISAINFAPKLFTELGYAPAYVGWLSGLFMMGSALGNLLGGALGDRFGGKPVILFGVIALMLPVYFYIPAEGIARFVLLIAAGFFSGMPHSILILKVQALLPGRHALAAGLALGFMFFSGSVGSYVLGIIADDIGLATALQGTATLPIVAAAASLLLPVERKNPAEAVG
jgi:MFS family permease